MSLSRANSRMDNSKMKIEKADLEDEVVNSITNDEYRQMVPRSSPPLPDQIGSEERKKKNEKNKMHDSGSRDYVRSPSSEQRDSFNDDGMLHNNATSMESSDIQSEGMMMEDFTST